MRLLGALPVLLFLAAPVSATEGDDGPPASIPSELTEHDFNGCGTSDYESSQAVVAQPDLGSSNLYLWVRGLGFGMQVSYDCTLDVGCPLAELEAYCDQVAGLIASSADVGQGLATLRT